ncbi:MAG: imelysin family protein [Cocleimonas sp.]|nr:imelysin family protein [Cocleimonas sp.]
MNLRIKKTLWLLSLLIISQSTVALDWSETNKAVTDDFAIPRFLQLLDSSKQLVIQTKTFCQKGDAEEFDKTRGEFHKTMDAWQQIQILRTGPQEMFMRNFRLQMWPDRSNTGAKQIRKLLANKDIDALKPEVFKRSSTAVQGLSAIERLIYSKDITATDFQENGKANYRCQLLQAITVNISSISSNLLKEWSGNHKEILATPGEENEMYDSHKEVATLLLKEVATELQAVYDQKFKRPVNKRFRYKRAESWRSERSLRNITLNLESAEALFKIGFVSHLKDETLKEKAYKEFREAIKTGKTFTQSLLKTHEEKPEELASWMKQVSQLKRTITVDVAKELDIALGFNSLDGD